MDPKLKITLFIIGMIIVFLVIEFTMAKMAYKPTLDWWNNNGGENYSDQFSMLNCMLSYYSSLLFFLNKMTLNPQQVLTTDQISFLVSTILPYQLHTDPSGNQTGILTPRHLCESVLLNSQDGDDQSFINWLQSSGKVESSVLVYPQPTSQDIKDGNNTYTYFDYGDPIPDSSGNIGVYPSPTDKNGWMGLVQEWGGKTLYWQLDKSGSFYSPEPLQGGGGTPEWFNWNNTGAPRPDNFLARMGITPDSPLVVYFCNAKYSSGSAGVVDVAAFGNLISPSNNVGGWLGYVKGMGENVSTDSYKNFIYTSVDWLSKPSKTCTPIPTGSPYLAAATTFLSGSMMAAGMGPAAPVGFALATVMTILTGLKTGGVIPGTPEADNNC